MVQRLTGTQPIAVGVRCAVDQRAVVSVSLLTETESLRASGFLGASSRTLWAPHLPSAGMPGSDPGSIGWGVSGQAWVSDRDPVSSALNRLSLWQAVKIRTGCFQASLIQTTYGFGAWKHPLRAIVDGKFDDCGSFNTRTLGSAGAGTMKIARFMFALTLSGANAPFAPRGRA